MVYNNHRFSQTARSIMLHTLQDYLQIMKLQIMKGLMNWQGCKSSLAKSKRWPKVLIKFWREFAFSYTVSLLFFWAWKNTLGPKTNPVLCYWFTSDKDFVNVGWHETRTDTFLLICFANTFSKIMKTSWTFFKNL